MSDINKILDDVLMDYGGRDENGTYTSGHYELMLGAMEQTLADDGWRRVSVPVKNYHHIHPTGPGQFAPLQEVVNYQMEATSEYLRKPRMTGQEFYDRFKKEYMSHIIPGKLYATDLTVDDVLGAAKKAAGVE